MTTEHTAAPWVALPEECDKNYIRIRGTQLGGRYKVANVLTPTYEGAHPREADETRANATLVASAPELLQALEALLDMDISYQRGPKVREAEIAARLAVAKARGTV